VKPDAIAKLCASLSFLCFFVKSSPKLLLASKQLISQTSTFSFFLAPFLLAVAQRDFVAVSSGGSKLAFYDPDEGVARVVGDFAASGTDHWGVAWNAASKQLIVTLNSYSATNLRYGVVDLCTGQATVVGQAQTHLALAVDFASNGTLFGVSYSLPGQNLMVLNLTGDANSARVVGATSAGTRQPMDLAIRSDGAIFMCSGTNSGVIQMLASNGSIVSERAISNANNVMGCTFNSSGTLLVTEYGAPNRLMSLDLRGSGPVVATPVMSRSISGAHSAAAIPRADVPACWLQMRASTSSTVGTTLTSSLPPPSPATTQPTSQAPTSTSLASASPSPKSTSQAPTSPSPSPATATTPSPKSTSQAPTSPTAVMTPSPKSTTQTPTLTSTPSPVTRLTSQVQTTTTVTDDSGLSSDSSPTAAPALSETAIGDESPSPLPVALIAGAAAGGCCVLLLLLVLALILARRRKHKPTPGVQTQRVAAAALPEFQSARAEPTSGRGTEIYQQLSLSSSASDGAYAEISLQSSSYSQPQTYDSTPVLNLARNR
jgi:hypothetical protein